MLFINLYVYHSSFICINPVVSHRRKSNVENRILFESKLFSFDGRAAVERNTQGANGGNATEEYGAQTRLGMKLGRMTSTNIRAIHDVFNDTIIFNFHVGNYADFE